MQLKLQGLWGSTSAERPADSDAKVDLVYEEGALPVHEVQA